MMIVDFATDFSESARDKLTRMNVDSGIFMFPFATEYRKQGNERKYHVFYLMGKGNINYKTVWITAKHTPACLAAREKERTERAAYEKRWQGYCRRCDAGYPVVQNDCGCLDPEI